MTTALDPFIIAADQLDPQFDDDDYESRGMQEWRSVRRPEQVPPSEPRDWYLWLIMAGRGWGKTRTGAEWLLDEMVAFPGYWYAMVGPTIDEGRDIMIEGESGLLACADARKIRYNWNKHLGQFTILGGARADLFTAEKPDGVRGPNLRSVWGDEPACLPGETLIRTDVGTKPIVDVRAGERVWTREGLRRVVWSGPTRKDAQLVKVHTITGTLTCTPDHQVWTKRGWVEAQYLESHDRLALWEQNAYVERVEWLTSVQTVYDLSIEGCHEFYADGFLVHNSWRYGQDVWDTLQFAMRKGDVRACLTGTPKTSDFMKYLIGQADVITKGHSEDNRANLSDKYYARVVLPYIGTRLGRRELAGEMLEDVEGALWSLELVEQGRVAQLPVYEEWENDELVTYSDLSEVVVAIDPAVTAKSTSDETGIVTGALGNDGHVYIVSDRSGRMAADKWAKTAMGVYDLYEADRIIGEVNNGGDLVLVNLKATCRGLGRTMPKFKAISASRGKLIRAEPVVGLYEQELVHHVGVFPKLEDEMTSWVPSDKRGKSPNRVDAMVYLVSDLLLAKQGRKLGYSVT